MSTQTWGDIQKLFDTVFVPSAVRGLHSMLLPGEPCFCFRVKINASGQMEPFGRSERYTAMVLIGMLSCQDQGLGENLPVRDIAAFVGAWGQGNVGIGDMGLALWALSLYSRDAVAAILDAILKRQDEIIHAKPFALMGMGWLLTGLSQVLQRDGGSPSVGKMAARLAQRILDTQNPITGLFPLAAPSFRRNFFSERVATRLGSFASQVYPVVGLSAYAAATGSSTSLAGAQKCAQSICDAQGNAGQWWWIYDLQTGNPAIRYPVYSVHQYGMGPMALLAIMRCTRQPTYLEAIARSVSWMFEHSEMSATPLIEQKTGILWRAIQRDNPERTGGFGLGLGERLRMQLAAWTHVQDNRMFRHGYLCNECRPYCLGWTLLANAWLSKAVQVTISQGA